LINLVFSTLILFCVSSLGYSQTDDSNITTIFLHRHAEAKFPPYKNDPPDPELNNAGKERAQLLMRTLASAEITEIYSTQRNRTIQTATPLAKVLGLEIQIYNGRELASFADQLKAKTGRILVSGHSNTTPELVSLLGGDPGEPINEKTQFDRIYVLTLMNGETIDTILLKYGVNYD